MKLLITGSEGQLGTELVRQSTSHEVEAVGRNQLDITDEQAVASIIHSFEPDVVINTAAYTAVDKAETNREAAFAINRDGTENLARYCAAPNIPLIHVSTDYVFDGTKNGAYVEDDVTGPLGVYGESKAAGEAVVREHCPRHLILRTSWVVSAHSNNFVRTMLRLGAEREELSVVADQHGCPTAAAELARGILYVLESKEKAWGTYHFCQPEPTTWHAFAEVIFTEARKQGVRLKVKTVKPVTSSEYSAPALRSANSVMDCSRFESTFDFTIHPWRESLIEIIQELKNG